MTQSSLLLYFHSKYCPVSVYCCGGKRHLLFGVGFKQWGRFHELYSVVSLTLGTPPGVPGCKLWMIYEVFLWLTGPGSSSVVRAVVCLGACVWP